MNPADRKIIIPLFLAVLCLSVFVMRMETYKKTTAFSIDEVVYYHLGLQLKKDISDYNTMEIRQWIFNDGRDPGEYFNQPLFKHPPLFFYLLVTFFHLFGEDPASAVAVSILFGVLMIPLVYAMGVLVFNRTVGILSAVFLAIDPVSIFSSQKIWMDSTLAFFSALTIYLFIYALRSGKDMFFILSGIAGGAAVLVKYPGVLATISVLTYVLLQERSRLKNKKVVFSFIIPLIMLLPWIYWNYTVYGLGFFWASIHSHNLTNSYASVFYFFGFLLLVQILSLGWRVLCRNPLFLSRIKGFVFVLFCFYFGKDIVLGLDLGSLPVASKDQEFFKMVSSASYAGKLQEYSFLYFFAFLSFFFDFRTQSFHSSSLKFAAMIILVFYALWSSVQSRYILAAIPFLIILASAKIEEIYQCVWRNPQFPLRLLGRAFLLAGILMIMARSYFINTNFSNNMCYF